MAIRIMDSIKTANDSTEFPVAFGNSIWLNKDKTGATENYSDLQTMYNNSELGDGGSSIQVDTMPIASAENENMIVEYVGASGTYQNGYFYQNIGSGDPKVYSWVQKNVQPSNATATNVSYDNTTSELVATNVQDAIDEIKGGLGSASGKNFTDLVRPNSHELVESGSVYSAINNALSSIYTPRGELTCAELTSSLLIEDNVGNIYTMSDSGTTSALFINGVGQTINVNDNVGIIKAGANTYLFNLMGDAFDLHDYQKKELSSGAMIEDVIPSNANASNKLVAKSEIDLRVDLAGNIDLNEYYANGKYIARNGSGYTVTNAPSDLPYSNNGFSLEVMSYGASDGNTDAFCTQILTAYTSNTVWIRSRFWGSDWFRWTSWQKLATTDNLTRVLEGDYQLQTGGDNYVWFDLGTSPNTANSQAYLFYEITYGRVDGLQSKILVSCGGTMADGNYIKIVNLNNAQTSASEQFKVDSNKHLWLGMQSYCDAHVKVYGRWSGMGGKTTIEPIGTVLPIYKLVTESDLPTLRTVSSTVIGNGSRTVTFSLTSGVSYRYICIWYSDTDGNHFFSRSVRTTGQFPDGEGAIMIEQVKTDTSVTFTIVNSGTENATFTLFVDPMV